MRRQARVNRERVAAEMTSVHEAAHALHGPDVSIKMDLEQRRPPTWLERLFRDPGDRDDPVVVVPGYPPRHHQESEVNMRRLAAAIKRPVRPGSLGDLP